MWSRTDVVKRARQLGRVQGLTVEPIPGRGKGSHDWWSVRRADGTEVTRLKLVGHSGDMSHKVTKSVEDAGTPAFGERWLER